MTNENSASTASVTPAAAAPASKKESTAKRLMWMKPKQLQGELRRAAARESWPRIQQIDAIVASIIFDNAKPQQQQSRRYDTRNHAARRHQVKVS